MINKFITKIKQEFFAFVFRIDKKNAKSRIYILPNKYGIWLIVAIGIILIASINYQLNLGYFFAFLLISLMLTVMLHTWRNLSQLTIKLSNSYDIFAKEEHQFNLEVNNENAKFHGILHAAWEPYGELVFAITKQHHKLLLSCFFPERGKYFCNKICFYSTYPLGIFYAWSLLLVSQEFIVYPKPIPHPIVFDNLASQEEGKKINYIQDDFHDLRKYLKGDSARHIAWKIYAKDKGLFTKQFESENYNGCWLLWRNLPAVSFEEKISIMCYWILQCYLNDMSFGIDIPGTKIAITKGKEHKNNCLKALAILGKD